MVGSMAQQGAHGPVFNVSQVPSHGAHRVGSVHAPVGSLQPPGVIGAGTGAGAGAGEGVGSAHFSPQLVTQSVYTSSGDTGHNAMQATNDPPGQPGDGPGVGSGVGCGGFGEGTGAGGGDGGTGDGGTYLSSHHC